MDTIQIPFDLKKISCDGSFFEDFVEKFPESCHVKDINKKFLITNHHMVTNCGLQTIDDIIGFTQDDILLNSKFQKKRNLSKITILNHIKSIQINNKIENQVLSTKCPVSTEQIILSNNGHIRFQYIIKTGIQNQNHKVIAILSIFLNQTNRIPLIKLFRLYQEFYPRREAIQKFLNHFNIERYFDPLMPLTSTETKILISMRDDPRGKSIARKFGVSVTTASNHISHIRSKLASSTLHDVLLKLPAVPEHEHSIYASI